MPNFDALKSLLELALDAALRGGDQILSVYNGNDFDVEIKGDGSPLTRADRLAQTAIAARLETSELPILSEEGRSIAFDERRSWGRFWMVDPLDGTKEFVKRNGEFTVNVALIEAGRPILGVVYAPAGNALYYGAQGLGAFVVRGQMGAARDLASLADRAKPLPDFEGSRPYRVVGSRSHSSPETEQYVDELRKTHPNLEMVSMGSSFKLCLVAEGTADVYPRFAPTMEWDTAAAQAVAEAAGRRVLQYRAETGPGEPVLYNKPDLLNPWFLVI